MKELDCIFIVFGSKCNEDWSNYRSLATKVIPNIGDEIRIDSKWWKVIRKMIDYTQVDCYTEIDDPGRGGEIVTIFVEQQF